MTRTCWSCTHCRLCAARIGVGEAIKNITMNIDGDEAPKQIKDIYEAVAGCCLDYSPSPSANGNQEESGK